MEAPIDLNKADSLAPYLGQDFLTWLWFKSEQQGGLFRNTKGEYFELYLEQRIQVQGGEGESKETTLCRGPHSELREARHGLAAGKKVTQAQLRFEQNAAAWQLQLKAEDFTLSGLKTPKVQTRPEEGEDPDGPFLEKIYLIEKALAMLDSLYAAFLTTRLGNDWPEERSAVKEWVEKRE